MVVAHNPKDGTHLAERVQILGGSHGMAGFDVFCCVGSEPLTRILMEFTKRLRDLVGRNPRGWSLA